MITRVQFVLISLAFTSLLAMLFIAIALPSSSWSHKFVQLGGTVNVTSDGLWDSCGSTGCSAFDKTPPLWLIVVDTLEILGTGLLLMSSLLFIVRLNIHQEDELRSVTRYIYLSMISSCLSLVLGCVLYGISACDSPPADTEKYICSMGYSFHLAVSSGFFTFIAFLSAVFDNKYVKNYEQLV